MAKISITVGNITTERVVDDARATAVLNLYDTATYQWQPGDPVTPTPRQRLQRVLDNVVGHIVETAQEYRRRELRAANEAAERAEAAAVVL